MSEVILKWKNNQFWCKGEVFKDGELIAKINCFYEVTPDWIFIYEPKGGSGTGYKPGEMIQKIFIGDCNFRKIELP